MAADINNMLSDQSMTVKIAGLISLQHQIHVTLQGGNTLNDLCHTPTEQCVVLQHTCTCSILAFAHLLVITTIASLSTPPPPLLLAPLHATTVDSLLMLLCRHCRALCI